MKIKMLLFTMLLSLAFVDCSKNKEEIPEETCTVTCDTGFVLNEETCECEKEPCTKTCDAGFSLNEETCECEKDEEIVSIPVCEGVKQPTPPLLKDDTTGKNDEKCAVFVEENGLLVMEAENTLSDYNADSNKWIFDTKATEVVVSGFGNEKNCNIVSKEITDHRGQGYLRFNGNWWSATTAQEKADFQRDNSLKYTFKVKNSGVYRLYLRAMKAIHHECRGDAYNDCFIKMEGDFEAGEIYSEATCVNTNNYIPPTKANLTAFEKLFGGSNERWSLGTVMDVNHKKKWPLYKLKAGETYVLTISGRSRNYFIDRIMMVDVHKYNWGEFTNYLNNATQNSCE
ncbi:hypothetical protein [Wenyingzhuangia sp. IMCC45574]